MMSRVADLSVVNHIEMNATLYAQHLAELEKNWVKVLSEHGFESALITAGASPYYYGDDQHPPFHAYGHFLHWVPEPNCEHAAIWFKPGQKPLLFWYVPNDYWYLPSSAPPFTESYFEVQQYGDLDGLNLAIDKVVDNADTTLFIGPSNQSEFASGRRNSAAQAINQLDYARAFKSQFELECMQEATLKAAKGHLAAEQAFKSGCSEYEIHQQYLSASVQTEFGLPYPNIVGLNEHAATLHYQHYDVVKPDEHLSLLIDAGGKSNCYHADITRTYTTQTNSQYGALIDALDDAQQAQVSDIKPGRSYLDMHLAMSLRIAEILHSFDLLRCSPESAFERKLTDTFFPHGLGHLLGLQTHDVGGLIVDDAGTSVEAHDRFNSLRLLRKIEPGMTFTVEPGIYFIPVLLEKIRGESDINWPEVNSLIPYGGIRIEDNVFVEDDGVSNLTRTAFKQLLESES